LHDNGVLKEYFIVTFIITIVIQNETD